MPRSLAGILAILCFLSPQLVCGESKSAREAVQTIRELRAIGLPPSNGFENGPPARIPGLLRQLNSELRTLVVETLNDQSRHSVPNEEEILEQLRAAGWDEIEEHKWKAYGEILGIDFRLVIGYEPGVLVVTTQLWVPCGINDPDSAVYVFQGEKRQWKLLLATDADFDFTGSSEANGMRYELSPPDSNGRWFLVLARTRPSCRRQPERLHYTVLRPGPSPDAPRVILNDRVSIDDQFEPPFRVRVEEDWFAVTRGKKRKLDGEPGVSIFRFMVRGDKVERVQPLALTPWDFLDEWVQLSWSEASRWNGRNDQDALEEWHDRLSRMEDGSTEIQSAQLCSSQKDGDSRWLVKLWIDREQNPSWEDEKLFIQISKRNGSFYLDRIDRTTSVSCPGQPESIEQVDLVLPIW